MPMGPFGPPPQVPVEMPNQSAVIVTCFGTVTATRITRVSPGRAAVARYMPVFAAREGHPVEWSG